MCGTERTGNFCHSCGHVNIDSEIAAVIRERYLTEGPLTKEVLTNITTLESLILDNNQISDISSLRSLSSLTTLDSLILNNNQISDVSSLASLTNLESLDLDNNQISDVRPLFDNLTYCSDCQKELTKVDSYCPYCGEKRIESADQFPWLTTLCLDLDQLIDKSPLGSIPNLESLNNRPFVPGHFILSEPDEPSWD